jgi:uncharacterized cupredoxin-like copper-binding protein
MRRIILDRTLRQSALAALCALLLMACGGPTTPEPPAGVRVVATEFRFEPAAPTLMAGMPMPLTLKNAGQTLHDFTIVSGPGIPTTAAQAPAQSPYHIVAEPGKEAMLTLNLPAGSYTFIYSVQGHKELGMQGTLTVQ